MRFPNNLLLVASLLAGPTPAPAAAENTSHEFTVSGRPGSLPPGYVPPLLSNGSLSMLIDYQGGQSQHDYAGMRPSIWWAGRRYGSPRYSLLPFGYFEQELSCNGEACKAPARWAQTLDTRSASVCCRCDYGDSLSMETTVVVHAEQNLVAVRNRLVARSPSARTASIQFKYHLTRPRGKGPAPWQTAAGAAYDSAASSIDVRYQVEGHRLYAGIVSLVADKPVTPQIDQQTFGLAREIALNPASPAEITYYLLFADSLDDRAYQQRSARLKALVKAEGFAGLLELNRRHWAKYWDESYVHVPIDKIEKAYATAQYHLKTNSTPWSFPVGIFDTHWSGRYFAWDEMFCFLGLASSNHLDLSRRAPEFRHAILPQAMARRYVSKSPKSFGAQYPWEALEDGSEGSPPGFWLEHVFHMSHVAFVAWYQYLYSGDLEYLRSKGYPVVRECATFFVKRMIYEDSNGRLFIGRCTDLERLGPDKLNPFMTACGAIFTLEAAARAAAILNVDRDQLGAWTTTARKLRESLPHDGRQYVPYAGCKDLSIAVLGGTFPYPVLETGDLRQKNAIYGFVKNGQRFGNMYAVGSSVCAWYDGWMAAALAALRDTTEPAKLLAHAAGGTGCFAEAFEINEEKVKMHPWFSTASGNFVYALNQVLLQSQDGRLLIAPAVPDDWRQFSFKLACHGNLVAEVAVNNGRIAELTLIPGDLGKTQQKTLIIPDRLVDPTRLNRAAVTSIATRQGDRWLDVRFKGRLRLIGLPR